MTEKYIAKNIGDKLSKLIRDEKFTENNFYTPRSLDKAVNMMLQCRYSILWSIIFNIRRNNY